MIVSLSVTQEDIDNGIKSSPTKCPVALALTRAMKKDNCAMGISRIILSGELKNTPQAILDFVYDFDRGKSVKPFELTFSI